MIQDHFQDLLQQEYSRFCDCQDQEHSLPVFITYLIDRELIPPVRIRQYTIGKEFDRLYDAATGKKSQIVRRLSERYNISERTVWTILRKEEGC